MGDLGPIWASFEGQMSFSGHFRKRLETAKVGQKGSFGPIWVPFSRLSGNILEVSWGSYGHRRGVSGQLGKGNKWAFAHL